MRVVSTRVLPVPAPARTIGDDAARGYADDGAGVSTRIRRDAEGAGGDLSGLHGGEADGGDGVAGGEDFRADETAGGDDVGDRAGG